MLAAVEATFSYLQASILIVRSSAVADSMTTRVANALAVTDAIVVESIYVNAIAVAVVVAVA